MQAGKYSVTAAAGLFGRKDRIARDVCELTTQGRASDVCRPLCQLITTTAATRCKLLQDTQRNQFTDIPQRGIWRALGNCGPFTAGELAFKAVVQAIDQFDLARVECGGRKALPEVSPHRRHGRQVAFAQHRVQRLLRLCNGAPQCGKKPSQPCRDIHRAFLSAL
jgi:hypothetical protein